MSTVKGLEERVAALEAEMAALRANAKADDTPGWKKFVGAFLNDPYFEEAMKYGRQYRESLRPKPKKRKTPNGDS